MVPGRRHRLSAARGPGLLLLLLGLAGLLACSKSIDERDLKLWTQNAEGLNRIEELMRNPELAPNLRVRALELMVERGLAFELPRMLRSAPKGKDLAQKLAASLLPRLEGDGEAAAFARDALVRLLDFVGDAQQEKIREAVATWAFDGLDTGSSKAKVKEQVEVRLPISHLLRLGGHGVRGAGLLIRHGFAVSDLASYLVKLGTPEARQTLATSLLAFHESSDIGWTVLHLSMVRDAEVGLAFAPMLKVYRNEALDDDVRSMALNAALAASKKALGDPATREKARKALDEVLKGDYAGDRWIAMNTIVAALGEAGVEPALGALEAGFAFADANEDPKKSMVDFCGDTLLHHAPKSRERVLGLLRSGTLPQKALAVVCIKVWRVKERRDTLEKIARRRRSRSLKTILRGVDTLASLARNALDGMDILDTLDAAGSMGKKELEARRFYATVILDKTGDDLRARIDELVKRVLGHKGK